MSIPKNIWGNLGAGEEKLSFDTKAAVFVRFLAPESVVGWVRQGLAPNGKVKSGAYEVNTHVMRVDIREFIELVRDDDGMPVLDKGGRPVVRVDLFDEDRAKAFMSACKEARREKGEAKDTSAVDKAVEELAW